jgi:hypothetical protein
MFFTISIIDEHNLVFTNGGNSTDYDSNDRMIERTGNDMVGG